MTDDELSAFLAQKLDAVIGIPRRDGGPQLSVIWFLWTGEVFHLSISNGSAKHKNLKSDPNVTLLINDSTAGKYLVAYGRVEIIEPIPHDFRHAMLLKHVPADQIDAWVARAPDDAQVGLILRPDRMMAIG